MATRFAWLRSRKTISLSIAIAAIALGLFTPKDANAGATILTHASYQDITSEANDFFVYGDLFDYPLGKLELRDLGGNLIQPTSVFSDYVILQFWNASFPPLEPGYYFLHVEDIYGDGETIIFLTVYS
ncbi:hypothetical protein [Singulisphaera acidiphila]|uniref:Uncharacterized protein n=1 Tax=Singulisphaera acidiphila (strain ATCC BAA-1392 / DSM 18658 / VKM B-2454 / MOB10) TaxID=886293 RepID=L0D9T5_SINAD|nr:hypothetical protein [Singulisphaera acidiphila]AGA26159.1 hypothetical protein Sinac_1790 [Singulisphaera acidiphila DSM 18658]